VDTELTDERIEALKEQAREVVRTREPESLQHALASIILRLETPSS
jgi:hypothetical protein